MACVLYLSSRLDPIMAVTGLPYNKCNVATACHYLFPDSGCKHLGSPSALWARRAALLMRPVQWNFNRHLPKGKRASRRLEFRCFFFHEVQVIWNMKSQMKNKGQSSSFGFQLDIEIHWEHFTDQDKVAACIAPMRSMTIEKKVYSERLLTINTAIPRTPWVSLLAREGDGC